MLAALAAQLNPAGMGIRLERLSDADKSFVKDFVSSSGRPGAKA